MDEPQTYRIIFLGDSGAGKTSILLRLVQNQFNPNQPPSINVSFLTTVLKIGEQSIKLYIFDTAGQERYGGITESYLRGADGALLVYDLTGADSFAKALQWFDRLIEKGYNYPTVLVGNKKDLTDSPDIKQAQEFAKDKDISFIQTSAKTGENIEETIFALAKAILDRKKAQPSPSPTPKPIKVVVKKEEKESKCCKNTT